jgi:Flp pilus assembly CpaE family ATPase
MMSSERPAVLLALTPLAERTIESLLYGERAVLTVADHVSEADELVRLAAEASVRAVLLSPGLSGITTSRCERLRAAGIRLIGLALDEHDEHALKRLSVETIVSHDAEPEELLEKLSEQPDVPATAPAPVAQPRERSEGSGVVVAVVGCKGAPGSSECAASLATLAASRWPALLVELDLLGGGLDVRLGSGAHDGSLLGLVRAVAARESVDELLHRWVAQVPGWPPVLLAPHDPTEALKELAQPGAIAGTLDALRTRVPFTVCDVGFVLVSGEEVSPPARVHREALVSADAVLLVLGARETQQRAGFGQLRLLLDQLAISPQRLRIAVNGIGAPGAASAAALKDTLVPRLAEHGVAPDAWLAWDARALSLARRKGRSLLAARPRGRYAKAIANLLDEMFVGQSVARTHRPKLKMPLAGAQPSEREEVALPWRR